MVHANRRKLLLTFDAFGTLFTPREPIAKQYGDCARRLGLSHIKDDELQRSFQSAFIITSSQYPNYGKTSGLRPQDWWANIIREAFKPFIRPGDALPDRIVPELISRFSTAEGYRIYPDVQPLFECIREARARVPSQHCHIWPWDETVVGIISNSDDRVPSILASLGLKVGKRLFGSESATSKLPVAEDDISFTVLSYDVGAEKPDGRIFDAAKSLLRASLDDQEKDSVSIEGEENPVLDGFTLLHVGDDLRKDVLGAKAAGWNSILLDRDASYLPRSMTDEQGTLTSSIERITINGRATKVTNDLSALKLWTP